MNGGSLSFREVVRKAPRREISMIKYNNMLRFLATLGMTILGFFLSSCSSSIPEPRTNGHSIKKNGTPTITVAKQFLPDGWADITSRSKQLQIKYWLVNSNNSATMVLRELQTDSSSQKSLMNEELNVIANISLLSKLPENNPDYRVTRVPAVIDAKRNFSSFAYSEKGLLRRVIVFKKQQKYFELELMQERSSAEFDELTNDLVTFAVTLYER
jgi:hypothetical protein